MFNRAKKQSFINELKSIYMAAEQKRITDTLTKSGHTAYARNSSNSCVGKLDLDGRDDIQYYIEFDTEGNVIKYYAKDGSFQYKSDKYGLKKTEITDAESIGSLDEEYIIDITCDGAGGKSNEPVTPEPEPSTPDTEIKYIVKYEPNGGTGSMESQEYTYGVESPLRENSFTKIGYTFNGWNTNPDGNGTSYNDKQIVNNLTNVNNEEIVLYAKWLDDIAPNCTILVSSKGTTSGVTSTVKCTDEGSKCKTDNPTGDTGLKESKEYTIYDNAGNSTKCSITVTSQLQSRTYNDCITGSNTCKYGCDKCGKNPTECNCKTSYRGACGGKTSYSDCNSCCGSRGGTCSWDKNYYGVSQGAYLCSKKTCDTCYSYYVDCNCSSCKTGSNTCTGGWNSWGNATSCSASDTIQCRTIYN